MRIGKMKKLIFVFVLLFTFQVSNGQDKKGNIVEYFGKEKVEEINEGKVIHVFKEGLVLGANRLPFGESSITTNPLFARVLNDGECKIFEGKQEPFEILDKKPTWGKIEVNEKNEFQGNNIRRSGYLYLEYESPNVQTMLFEASGHTDILINGLPHEGDYYDYGWSLIPVQLKKGKNEFILRGGRFPRLRARLLEPNKPVQFTKRDMTLPDIIKEEDQPVKSAIRVINSTEDWFKDASVVCTSLRWN